MPHNGGKSQVVFWFPLFAGDFPFLNHVKGAERWSCIDNSVNFKPNNHDDNGYVHTIENGGVKQTYVVPTQVERPGNYVIKWDGGGTIHRSMASTTVSGSLTSLAGTLNNRCEFSTSASTFITGVSGVATPGGGAGDYPTNIRVCHVDDEALLDAGEVFSTMFKQELSKIGVLRFLDWQLVNTSALRRWEDATPVSHYSYGAPYIKKALYAGFTTNVGDVYASTFGAATLTDGEQVIVTFNATSSGFNPTFNRNGTGDLPIKFSDGRTIAFDVWKPAAGWTGILTYVDKLKSWLKIGGDTESKNTGLYTVPIPIIARLCKEVGAHPWVHIPYFAVDPMTNFPTEIASYFKNYAETEAPWMVPRYEPINEVWNSAAGFIGTRLSYALEGTYAATVWKNYWLTATAYSVGDGVFNGDSWICGKAHNSSGTLFPGAGATWVTATSYVVDDLVRGSDATTYICLINHTSGATFNPDLVAGKWVALWTIQQDYNNWYGRISAKVFKAISAVYGNDRTKYQTISAGWATQTPTGTFDHRLDSTRYLTEAGVVAGDAAKFWATHVSVANYWHSSYAGTATELSMATEWLTATADRKSEIELDYLTSTAGSVSHHMENCKTRMTNWHNWGVAKGVNGFAPYEGGYDWGYTEGSGDRQTFTRAVYASRHLKRLTQVLYQFIDGIGEFPSQYTFTGASSWGYGGVGINIHATEYSAQWDGIVDYSLGKRTFLLQCAA